MYNESTGKIFYEKLEYIFIEIPKFDKAETELQTDLDQWLFILKNMSKLGKIPVLLTKRIFQKLFKIAEVANLSKEDYMAYERSLKAQWDEYANREGAKMEGRAIGMKEGMKEGLKEGMKEGMKEGVALGEAKLLAEQEKAITKLLKLGLSGQQIADIQNVSEAFVQEIKEKHS